MNYLAKGAIGVAIAHTLKLAYVQKGRVESDVAYYDMKTMFSVVAVFSLFVLSGHWSWFSIKPWNATTLLSVNRWLRFYFTLQFIRFVYEITDRDSNGSIIGTILRKSHLFVIGAIFKVGSSIGHPAPGSLISTLITFDAVDVLLDAGAAMALRNVYILSPILVNLFWIVFRILLPLYATYSGYLVRGMSRYALYIILTTQATLFFSLPRSV